MEFWDLLFKRYANPLILMQQMLDVGRLDEFIDNVLKFHNDEQKEDFIFKLWLHKEYEGNPSYEKFRADFFEPPQTAKTKSDFEAELKDTVLKSQQILESFSLN